MYIGKYIKKYIRRLWYDYKMMGKAVFVPIVFFCMVLWLSYNISGRYPNKPQEALLSIINGWQFLIPFFSIIWPLIFMREHIESDGNDILHILSKNKFPDILGMFLVYSLWMTAFFGVLMCFTEAGAMEYIQILIPCLWFCAWFYTLIYIMGSIVTVTAVMLAYTIMCMGIVDKELLFVYVYYEEAAEWGRIGEKYIPLLIISGFVFAVGILLNRRYERYK